MVVNITLYKTKNNNTVSCHLIKKAAKVSFFRCDPFFFYEGGGWKEHFWVGHFEIHTTQYTSS